jgi:hypothetical protein
MTLAQQTCRLADTDLIQPLASAGASSLSLFAFHNVSVPREGSASSGPTTTDPSAGASRSITVRYRRADTGATGSLQAALDDPLSTLLARLRAAERIGLPLPAPTAARKKPGAAASAPSPSSPSTSGGQGEGGAVKWAPGGMSMAIARRGHFIYTTAATEAKTLEAWGFGQDAFVYVLPVGVKDTRDPRLASTSEGFMECFAAR